MHKLKKLKTNSYMCEINSFAIVYFFLDDRLFDNKAAFKFSILPLFFTLQAEHCHKYGNTSSPIAINSLITQSACAYLDLLPHIKRMLTEIYAGNQYFIIQYFSKTRLFIYKSERLKWYFL